MGRQSLKTKAERKGGGRKTKTAAAMTKERNGAIGQMNSKLKRKFTKIEKSVNDLRAENLRYYWNIGKICEEIRDNPDQYLGKDGTPGLKLIEQALSTQARTLRKAAMFARTYDEEGLEWLIGLQHTETNFQLHWGHVSFLLTCKTDAQRERFAQMAVDKMLDPPALHEKIKKGTSRGGGHGRKHEMPKTVPAQIRQIITICRQWVGKDEGVWNGDEESVFGNIMNLAPEEMDAEMVEQLEEISGLMATIQSSAGENIGRADRAKEHLEATIQKRDEREAAEAEAGRETRAIDLEGDGTGGRRRRRRGSAA